MKLSLARSSLALIVACSLASCAGMQVHHYLPSGDGELRNRSLCTLGLRDELETALPGDVKIRVWGGDPDTTALSARVQVLIPPNQNLRFASPVFTLWSKGASEPQPLIITGITTACPAEAAGCRSRYAPTDWLEGGVVEGSGLLSTGMLKTTEPRTYRMDLAIPVAPGEPYTLKLPDIELNGKPQSGPTVRFDKTTTAAATNLQVCQP